MQARGESSNQHVVDAVLLKGPKDRFGIERTRLSHDVRRAFPGRHE